MMIQLLQLYYFVRYHPHFENEHELINCMIQLYATNDNQITFATYHIVLFDPAHCLLHLNIICTGNTCVIAICHVLCTSWYIRWSSHIYNVCCHVTSYINFRLINTGITFHKYLLFVNKNCPFWVLITSKRLNLAKSMHLRTFMWFKML